MISIIDVLMLALICTLTAFAPIETNANIVSLLVGTFFHRSGNQVSARSNATTEHSRSPWSQATTICLEIARIPPSLQ